MRPWHPWDFPFAPGYLMRSRAATCGLCNGAAAEHLIRTSVSPNGVWVLVCGRCGT